jgi:hypothetical protein
LGPDVPTTFFKMSSIDLLASANTSLSAPALASLF